MEHDIGQLLERIGRGAEVSTLEFETLIHQCRKRKWCDEVTLVLRTMAILGREGIEGAGTIGGEGERTGGGERDSRGEGEGERGDQTETERELRDLRQLWSRWVPSHGLPPQPQVLPSHTTLMGALDAYIDMGAVDVAWEVIVHNMESSWEVGCIK